MRYCRKQRRPKCTTDSRSHTRGARAKVRRKMPNRGGEKSGESEDAKARLQHKRTTSQAEPSQAGRKWPVSRGQRDGDDGEFTSMVPSAEMVAVISGSHPRHGRARAHNLSRSEGR